MWKIKCPLKITQIIPTSACYYSELLRDATPN